MPECSHCHTQNPVGDRFCSACGKPLSASDSPDSLLEAGLVCPKCETYNEPLQKVCVSCGHSLSGLTGFMRAIPEDAAPMSAPAPSVPSPPAQRDTMRDTPAAARTPTPPAVSPTPPSAPLVLPPTTKTSTGRMPAAIAASPTGSSCPFCQAQLPAGVLTCLVCGQRLNLSNTTQPAASDVSVRLRLVRGMGREDSTYPVGPASVSVGRASTMLISVPTDPALSPFHFHARWEGSRLMLEDQQSYNGTFIRVRGQTDIKQGAEFVLGGHRLLLMGLGGPTTDVRATNSAETKSYGGPLPRQLFVALRELHRGPDQLGRAGMVLLRTGPIISIGQRGCDINFPADNLLSSRHVELHLRPTGVQLLDASSSSGVFVRVRNATLHNGDEIMAGNEIFRVEMG